MGQAIAGYRPPSHRCELVGEIGGYAFFNDSKATNLHALESSLRSQEGKVVLIAGGKEKGLDYGPLAKLVSEKVVSVIAIGEIGGKLVETWGGLVPCRVAATLDEAVAAALAEVGRFPQGTAVLFSPGTSSFDMFSGYEERGDTFRRIVLGLQQTNQIQPTKPA
jgi:UDP-N-acetylmuramoylalanine--D-glutamate ligase